MLTRIWAIAVVAAALLWAFMPSVRAQEEAPASPAQSASASTPARWTMANMSTGHQHNLHPAGRVLRIKLDQGRWRLAGQDEANDEDDTQEVITVTADNVIVPTFSANCKKGQIPSDTECSCTRGTLGMSRKNNGYTLCTSHFKTVSAGVMNAATTAVATLLYGITGSTSIVYKVDTEAMLNAFKEAGALDLLNQDYHARYLDSFKRIQTTDGATRFIRSYEGVYDPEQLVPKAQALKLQYADAEARQRADQLARDTQRREQERLQALAQKEQADKLNKERARLEQEENARLAKELTAFRKRLKVGDDTFCGYVIEINRPMVKIALAAQLQGFGSEKWLRIEDVYPSHFGCINQNGNIRPQSLVLSKD